MFAATFVCFVVFVGNLASWRLSKLSRRRCFGQGVLVARFSASNSKRSGRGHVASFTVDAKR
jgi:hypothetical protein